MNIGFPTPTVAFGATKKNAKKASAKSTAKSAPKGKKETPKTKTPAPASKSVAAKAAVDKALIPNDSLHIQVLSRADSAEAAEAYREFAREVWGFALANGIEPYFVTVDPANGRVVIKIDSQDESNKLMEAFKKEAGPGKKFRIQQHNIFKNDQVYATVPKAGSVEVGISQNQKFSV